MSKKLMILIFSIFLIACSNINIQNKFSEEQKKDLYEFTLNIKENLSINNFDYLKKNMEKSIRNNHILKELEEIDFSDINIFISKAVFINEKTSSILGLNIGEDTFYFELNFIYNYHSKKWLISEVKERR